jgi:hypothetical protein
VPRRNRADAVLARRTEVARLYCGGLAQHEIATRVGVSQSQVFKDLVAVRNSWRQAASEDFADRLGRELAKLDEVEREAWAGYQRSMRTAVKKTAKVIHADGDVRSESTETREEQAGDPRFLQVAESCIDRRLRILGAYAAAKDEAPGPSEVVILELGPGCSLSTFHGGHHANALKSITATPVPNDPAAD